jgi:hypothetical protein
MIVVWKVGGVRLVGIVDHELGRWTWGEHHWRWPWVRIGSA